MSNTIGAEATTIIGGVDTHAETHHAAVLDPVGRLLGTREFSADACGYRALLRWLESFGRASAVGVEGTDCYGAGLTRYLRSRSITTVEINRPDRQARRLRGKSDPLDAESAARRLLGTAKHALPKDSATAVESIRVLRVTRGGAVKARTAALNQLKNLITTAPDPLRRHTAADDPEERSQQSCPFPHQYRSDTRSTSCNKDRDVAR